MKQITQEEWNRKHRDFKSIIEGQKYILANLDGKGTCLVPVQIIKNQVKTEGKNDLD